jgi:hypothetical protein
MNIFVKTRAWDRICLAEDPRTSLEILEKLSTDDWWLVRNRVAGNPNTPAKILYKLSYDTEPGVLMKVAENPNTPASTLWSLTASTWPCILEGAATNPSAPPELLDVLSNDVYCYEVLRNPSTPKYIKHYFRYQTYWK